MTDPERPPNEETGPGSPNDESPPDLAASIGRKMAALEGSLERYQATIAGFRESVNYLESMNEDLRSVIEAGLRSGKRVKGDFGVAHDVIEAAMKQTSETSPIPRPGQSTPYERIANIMMRLEDGDQFLSQLIGQGNLNTDELTIAICLGGDKTLRQLVNQCDQLNEIQQVLIKSVATYRKLAWLLKILDEGPETDGGDRGPGPDPGSGGPGSSPVGARPVGPSPNNLTASLTIPKDHDYVDAIDQQLPDKIDQPVR